MLFAAVLILGIQRDWSLEISLERANQFAARIVAQTGATAADPGLYEPFIDQWGLAPVNFPSLIPPLVQSSGKVQPKTRARARRV